MIKAGLPVNLMPCGWTPLPNLENSEVFKLLSPYVDYSFTGDIRISHWQPSYFKQFRQDGVYNIGLTVWEMDKLDKNFVNDCNLMDEIWVPCEKNIEAFKRSGVKPPIYKTFHAYIEKKDFTCEPVPELEGFPKQNILFYSIFAWQERKSPELLIESFFEAFYKKTDVNLLLKLNWIGDPVVAATINRIASKYGHSNLPPIIYITRRLSEPQINYIQKRGDIHVSPTKSEGWGLCTMSSIANGKPTIATRYYGHEEFMTKENSFPLENYTMVKCNQVNAFYKDWMKWANPSKEELVAKMQQVYQMKKENNPELNRICQNGKQLKEIFSTEKIGNLLKTFVTRIRNAHKTSSEAHRTDLNKKIG